MNIDMSANAPTNRREPVKSLNTVKTGQKLNANIPAKEVLSQHMQKSLYTLMAIQLMSLIRFILARILA